MKSAVKILPVAFACLALSQPAFAQNNVQIDMSALENFRGQQAYARYEAKQRAPQYPQKGTYTPEQLEQKYKLREFEAGFVPLAQKAPAKKLTKKEQLSQPPAPKLKKYTGTPPPFNLWSADWSGRANISTSFQKGNGENKNIDFDTMAKAQWDNKDRLTATLEIGYEDDSENTTVDEQAVTLSFDDFMTPALYIDYDTRLEKNDVSGVDLRWNSSVGLGHQLFDEPRLKVDYSLGLGFLMEELQNDQDKENQKDMSYNWKLNIEKTLQNDVVTLYHKHNMITPTEDTNDYVFESNTGLRMPLREKMIATLDLEHDIDEGAAEGFSKTDTKYSLKLGYEW